MPVFESGESDYTFVSGTKLNGKFVHKFRSGEEMYDYLYKNRPEIFKPLDAMERRDKQGNNVGRRTRKKAA